MLFKVETWKEQRWIGDTRTGYEATVHVCTLQDRDGRVVSRGEGGTPQAAQADLLGAIKCMHAEHWDAFHAAWRERHVKP